MSDRLPAPSFSWQSATCGRSTASPPPLPLQLQHLPVQHDHYGMRTRRVSRIARATACWELPVTTTRLFGRNLPAGAAAISASPPTASRAGRLRASTARNSGRRSSTSTPGNRPRAAAHEGCRRQDALPPLPEPASDQGAADAVADRLTSGTGSTASRRGGGVNLMDAPTLAARPRVRAVAAADEARWDAFVEACPQATFFHRIGWKRIVEEVFRHRTHYCWSSAAARSPACCRWRRCAAGCSATRWCRCRLPSTAASPPTTRRPSRRCTWRRWELARELGVEHLELRNLQRTEPDWPQQDLYVTFRKPILPEVEATCSPSRASSGRWCARQSAAGSPARSTRV